MNNAFSIDAWKKTVLWWIHREWQTAGEKVSFEMRKDEQIVGKLHGAVFKGQSRLMIG